jgi:alpha/beta superfamily hydrolase
MDNTVVHRTARALREAGLTVLRFNFRGVGESEGTHDGRGGEEGDVIAALDQLSSRHPGVPLWAAGFSFGARTVASLALREARIERYVCVALPVLSLPMPALGELAQPGLVVQAGADEFGNLADLREHLPEPPDGMTLAEVEGADHLFRRRSKELEETIHRYALAALEEER